MCLEREAVLIILTMLSMRALSTFIFQLPITKNLLEPTILSAEEGAL